MDFVHFIIQNVANGLDARQLISSIDDYHPGSHDPHQLSDEVHGASFDPSQFQAMIDRKNDPELSALAAKHFDSSDAWTFLTPSAMDIYDMDIGEAIRNGNVGLLEAVLQLLEIVAVLDEHKRIFVAQRPCHLVDFV